MPFYNLFQRKIGLMTEYDITYHFKHFTTHHKVKEID